MHRTNEPLCSGRGHQEAQVHRLDCSSSQERQRTTRKQDARGQRASDRAHGQGLGPHGQGVGAHGESDGAHGRPRCCHQAAGGEQERQGRAGGATRGQQAKVPEAAQGVPQPRRWCSSRAQRRTHGRRNRCCCCSCCYTGSCCTRYSSSGSSAYTCCSCCCTSTCCCANSCCSCCSCCCTSSCCTCSCCSCSCHRSTGLRREWYRTSAAQATASEAQGRGCAAGPRPWQEAALGLTRYAKSSSFAGGRQGSGRDCSGTDCRGTDHLRAGDRRYVAGAPGIGSGQDSPGIYKASKR